MAGSAAKAVEFGQGRIGDRVVTTVIVDPKAETLRMFHRDDQGQPIKRLDALAAWRKTKGETLVFAMNAGMYHGNFSAVGLHVENGRELVPVNLADGEGNFFLKPNGVLLVGAEGARVVVSTEYPAVRAPVLQATQSGPILLRSGRIHPVFNPQSKNKLHRNGVGVRADGKVVFAITEAPVSFHEFAVFFRDEMKCPDALFLDGTVCSLYAPKLGRNDFRMELGPMIGVVEKAK